jgi:hypothetical protein
MEVFRMGTPVFQRVVPLPPPEGAGAVKFTNVFLSLAYDTFGVPNAPTSFGATIKVLKTPPAAPVTIPFTVVVGRTVVVGGGPGGTFQPGDLAVSVQLNPPSGFHPEVTALVEYTTPI